MKNWGFLSVTLFLLSGCISQGSDYDLYNSSDLRAPAYQPYERAAKVSANDGKMPQSVTQPMNINPVPQQQPANSAAAAPQPAQPTQPLVQTIVIPQYTPTAGVMPYGQMPYGVQPVGQPYNNAQQITIPSQQVYMPSAIPENVVNAPTEKIDIPQPKIKVTPAPAKKAGEQVYPAWAASDFKAQTQSKANSIVYFKNPHRNETVQCAAIDVMCIASYQQQGYKQVNFTQPVPVDPKPSRNKSGYPDTDWDINSIPRW